MTLRRLLAAAAASITLVLLSGCFALPQLVPVRTPTPTEVPVEELDIPAIEEELLAVMPAAGDGFIVVDSTGLDEITFGADWSQDDHDAPRLARALRTIESVGWADPALGAGYWFDVEIVLMDSVGAADAAMFELAAAISEPYTLEVQDGTSEVEFSPLAAPSGRFPFGALEQERRQVWSTGERAAGWATYYASGPFILIVFTAAVPFGDSPAALDAFTEQHLPPLLAEFEELTERLLG